MELISWYKKLINEGWADNYDIRFVMKSKTFIPVPKHAKSVIYWKEGDYYYVAANHHTTWGKNYSTKNSDIECWINPHWMSRGRGISNSKKSDPEIMREQTVEQIQQRLIDKQREQAILNTVVSKLHNLLTQ